MKNWYKKSFRRNLVDMHIEDWDEKFLSKFDSRVYFENLQRGNIKSPMLYFNSHVGYCYWPTKTGHMHRSFKGREDALIQLINLCHQADMDVVAYYSLIFNNWAYDKYHKWRMVNVEGKASRENGCRYSEHFKSNRYGLCCPNNMEYRQFTYKQIEEFCDYFDFEGIFFDMTFWPMVCYCDSCKLRWEKEVGGEMPTTIDWNNSIWLKFQEKRTEWLSEYAMNITACLKKYKPECTVEHQYAQASYFWRFGVTDNISSASDYAGGDLYGGIEQQSFACKLYYNLTRNQPFEYMTSLCYPNLAEHTSLKSIDMLKLSIFMTYAHHGACLMIDAIDTIGTLQSLKYERIGEVLRETEKYEVYLEGNLIEDVGIYYSLEGKMDRTQKAYVFSLEGEDMRQPHLDAALVAAKILRENHIPFGVLNNYRLDLLGKVKVLILPDVPFMSSREIEAVKTFVCEGGKLYFSGYTAPELVEVFFGARHEGITEEGITFMSPVGHGCSLMPEFDKEHPMTLFKKQILLSGEVQGEILALTTLPETVPPETMWSGRFPEVLENDVNYNSNLSYRFTSIHSNPPGKYTSNPAIIKGLYGKGIVIWAAAPIEEANRPQHSEVFIELIREMENNFSFKSNAPKTVELIMFEVPEKNRQLISCLNVQESFNITEIGTFAVSIMTDKCPRRVVLLPDESEQAFNHNEGWVTITITGLKINKMIMLEY